MPHLNRNATWSAPWLRLGCPLVLARNLMHSIDDSLSAPDSPTRLILPLNAELPTHGNSPYFRHKLIGGFYGAIGYAPRTINGSSHINNLELLPNFATFRSYTQTDPYKTTHGVLVAGGLETRFGPIHLSPEIRYTHWSSPALNVEGPRGFHYQMAQEQLDVLVGISFHPLR